MGKKLIVGVNDLKSVNPALASEWNYEKNGKLLPENISANSGQKVWWKGECRHEWDAIVSNRNKGYGCPYCSGQKVLKGFNDLMTKRPDLASEWNYEKNGDLKPDMIMPGTNKKVWWVCDKGHEWEESPNNRTNAKTGCPYCSGHRVLKGFNDLQTVNPTLASEWDYEKNENLKPTDVTIGAHQMVWWRCNEGHEWKSTIPNRIKGAGCSICSGRQVLKGVNDLLTKRPDIA